MWPLLGDILVKFVEAGLEGDVMMGIGGALAIASHVR